MADSLALIYFWNKVALAALCGVSFCPVSAVHGFLIDPICFPFLVTEMFTHTGQQASAGTHPILTQRGPVVGTEAPSTLSRSTGWGCFCRLHTFDSSQHSL